MNKSNKYTIHYNYYDNFTFIWKISVKKLKLSFRYYPNKIHYIANDIITYKSNKLCNFLIEPNLITMLKSKDPLTINLAFEILNNRLNERTKQNTKGS